MPPNKLHEHVERYW